MPIEIESPEQLGYHNIKFNLAESSVTDVHFHELGLNLDEVVLGYGDHLGKPQLRELVAAKYPGIHSDDVLITAGAASALFIIATSLLEKDDRIVVEFPNYATNIETPLAIGCDVVKVDLRFEDNFRLNVDKVKECINSRTKLISVTNPHNPTGVVLDEEEIQWLIKIAEDNNCFLLIDETYRDLTFGEKSPLAASLSENVISVSSLSKAYGLPGIRIGWIATRNKKLMETFLAAKEQIFICNSILDEEIACRFLQNEAIHITKTRSLVQNNLTTLCEWMDTNEHLEWIVPQGGVVCFPRLKLEMKIDPKEFYRVLFNEYETMVGPGHWFGMDDRYMRIGFGWPTGGELMQGLANITSSLWECSRG